MEAPDTARKSSSLPESCCVAFPADVRDTDVPPYMPVIQSLSWAVYGSLYLLPYADPLTLACSSSLLVCSVIHTHKLSTSQSVAGPEQSSMHPSHSSTERTAPLLVLHATVSCRVSATHRGASVMHAVWLCPSYASYDSVNLHTSSSFSCLLSTLHSIVHVLTAVQEYLTDLLLALDQLNCCL